MDGLLDFVTPDQRKAMQQDALTQSLLTLGPALLQASTGAPGQGKPRLGQILGQALPVGVQAYQGGIDRALQQMMLSQQMAEQQKRRQAEQSQMQAREQVMAGLPPDQRQRLAAFPEMAKDVLFPKPEETSQVYRDYVMATRDPINPFTGSFMDYQTALKQAGRTQVAATATAGGRPDTFQEEVKKGLAKQFVDIERSGIAAQRSAQDVNRLDKLLSKVDTGGAAAFKQAAGNFGIKTEGLDDIQAAQAIINKLVPAQRPPGSGPMSDADLELFKQSMPRIINQPGGNKLIIDGMKQINRYLIEEGKIAAEVTAGRITPEEGTARILALGNPIQDFFEQGQSETPQGVTVRRIR